MQSPADDPMTSKSVGRLLGPALGDQKQGSFSINLWKHAFQEALKRLCPVRAGSHECGCLPVLTRRVSILQGFYFSSAVFLPHFYLPEFWMQVIKEKRIVLLHFHCICCIFLSYL